VVSVPRALEPAPPSMAFVTSSTRRVISHGDNAPNSARRAPRALEDVEKVLTDRGVHECAVPLDA
jgi:hypothetical protein